MTYDFLNKVSVAKGIVTHYGILVKDRFSEAELVVHHPKGGKPVVSEIHDFTGGKEMNIGLDLRNHDQELLNDRLDNAFNSTGNYSFLGANCEHFVNDIVEGKKRSPQLQTGVVLSLAAIVLLILVKNNKSA